MTVFDLFGPPEISVCPWYVPVCCRAQMRIFSPEKLWAFASEACHPDRVQTGLELQRQLCNRHVAGWLEDLTELRVEQSFNERLFAEIFDYRTLFRDGFS